MENNFVFVQRHPTPEELLKAFLQIVPEFASHWESADNLFRNDDGSFSVHGVFAQLSWYVKDNFSNLTGNQRQTLFESLFRTEV